MKLSKTFNIGAIKYIYLYIFILILISSIGASKYNGDGSLFLLFSIVFNILLMCGIREKANFFDFYIGVFLWMGFWLKLTVRILFFDSKFSEATGAFNYSAESFDRALIVSTIGATGLIVASLIRERLTTKFIQQKDETIEYEHETLYVKYKSYILMTFITFFICIAFVNINMGIYQKGEITKTILPYGINGVIKWLILFGFSSFSAVILKMEIDNNKKIPVIIMLIIILESFFSNTSLLSRGMILNIGALAIGALFIMIKNNLIKINAEGIIISSIIFFLFFFTSVAIVNDIRGNGSGYVRTYIGDVFNKNQEIYERGSDLEHATPLLLNRWVGIEGVLSVSSSNKLGWSLWKGAWSERYSENTMGFYDSNLIDSPYKNTDFTKKHHLSLPGIVAFLFYPGSIIFLFLSMMFSGLFASLIEVYVYIVGRNNLILCSLISMVVAYRFASFGYVPSQSYLLFGSIIISIILVRLMNDILRFKIKKKI